MNQDDVAVADEETRESLTRWRRGLQFEEFWDEKCFETNKCAHLVQSENVERLLDQEYSKSQRVRNRI